MIPKIIHYCWFGRRPKPQKVLGYIETWKKYFPDFEIKEWNEDNFDINMMPYTKEAYFAKKYAFVSDVARLYALNKCGGIYFDTDIRVLKRFSDDLLNSDGFLGFEHEQYVTTGVMASNTNNALLEEIFSNYLVRRFFSGFKYDETTNVSFITNFFKSKGLVCDNKMKYFKGFVFLPQVYLCANDWRTKRLYNNNDTYTIHEFSYTWGNSSRLRKRIVQLLTILKYQIRYEYNSKIDEKDILNI